MARLAEAYVDEVLGEFRRAISLSVPVIVAHGPHEHAKNRRQNDAEPTFRPWTRGGSFEASRWASERRMGREYVPMKGRRLPLGEWPKEPGDYMGPIMHDGVLCVFFLKPNARDADAPRIARAIHHVSIPPHTARECADGSLEIRASLGDRHTEIAGEVSDGWHGYLDEGHEWRKC